jgi:hypothetical protein
MPLPYHLREQPQIDSGWIRQLLSRPALDDADVIQQALRFANTGGASLLLKPLVAVSQPSSNLITEMYSPEHPGEQEALREALTAIVRKQTTPEMIQLWQSRASRLMLLPAFQMEGGKRRVAFRSHRIEVFDTPPDPQFAYLLLLFLDSDKPYGRDLCQCNLERCRKFFLADRTQPNRPRTRFCSEAHYQESHDAAAVDRVRRSRDKRRHKQLKRRR